MHLYLQILILFLMLQPIYGDVNLRDDSSIDTVHHADNFIILVGDRAQRNQFPYQVSVRQFSEERNFYYHICSGAIVSDKWVLSTAYCATSPETPLRIVAGSIMKYETHPDVQMVDVDVIVVHPDYKRDTFENDIALLELQTLLVFTHSVQPIPIEFYEEVWGPALLSGWNVQTQLLKLLPLHNLQYMIVHVMFSKDCEKVLQDSTNFTRNVMCSKQTTEEFYCPGESGSPLVQRGYLVGLTSRGLKPCDTTVYTKVASFVEFIRMYVVL